MYNDYLVVYNVYMSERIARCKCHAKPWIVLRWTAKDGQVRNYHTQGVEDAVSMLRYLVNEERQVNIQVSSKEREDGR